MFYYKQTDEEGNLISVMVCGSELKESQLQVRITEEEYEAILESIPEPEEPGLTDEISGAELLRMIEEVL